MRIFYQKIIRTIQTNYGVYQLKYFNYIYREHHQY